MPEFNPDGSPKLFELMPSGTKIEGVDGMWALFADERALRTTRKK